MREYWGGPDYVMPMFKRSEELFDPRIIALQAKYEDKEPSWGQSGHEEFRIKFQASLLEVDVTTEHIKPEHSGQHYHHPHSYNFLDRCMWFSDNIIVADSSGAQGAGGYIRHLKFHRHDFWFALEHLVRKD